MLFDGNCDTPYGMFQPFDVFDDSFLSLSDGMAWSGFTPYFLFRALPAGQPPKVTIISILWRILAIGLPFLAFVQTGQWDSQKSGSLKFMLLVSLNCLEGCVFLD